jgi:hypothetical protein
MPPSAARCGKSLLYFVLAGAATQAYGQVDARDALIEDLRRRIDTLEKRVSERPPVAQPGVLPKPPAEEAAEKDESVRALERTLVREGGLVLPRGAVEAEPRLQYTFRGTDALGIVDVAGVAQVAPQDVKRNELEASVGVRVGLPWSSQIELRVPYVWLHESRAAAGQSESQRSSGAGDMELLVAKQLLTGRGGRPSALASLNWKTVTGEHASGSLSPGSGFHQLQAAVTVVTRQDPLVFFAAPSYTAALERTRSGTEIDPGDAVGLKAGALLAASPDTSLLAGFVLSR